MIKNFNFYDIYGYLIPGLAVLGVFWLPFGLATGVWPAQEWSSALIFIVLAYIVGHVLQTFTHIALPDSFPPSKPSHGAGKLRFPSDTLLDGTDKRFTHEFKGLLCKKINEVFKLKADYDEAKGAVMESRGIAFFLCRSALLRCGAGAYAEQMQGMYVLTRGLSAAFALGAALYLGWAAGSVCETNWPGRSCVAWLAGAVALLAIFVAALFAWGERPASEDEKSRPQRGSALSFMIAVLLLGLALGQKYPDLQEGATKPEAVQSQGTCCVKIIDTCCDEKNTAVAADHKANSGTARPVSLPGWLFGLALAEILFSIKLYDTFKRFALTFAENVYRDFLALGACCKPGAAGAAASSDENGE